MGKGEQTRRAIVKEAMDLASTVGLTGLTIGSLAKSLKMSKSGLFAHFRSKEQLQLQILEEARQRFIEIVVMPAIKKPRGIPRVRGLFEGLIVWERQSPGGCVFVSASAELDDQPGPSREALVVNRRDWMDTIAQAAQITVDEGQFRADLDVQQFTFEFWSLVLGFHQVSRLLGDPESEARLRTAFDRLLERSQ